MLCEFVNMPGQSIYGFECGNYLPSKDGWYGLLLTMPFDGGQQIPIKYRFKYKYRPSRINHLHLKVKYAINIRVFMLVLQIHYHLHWKKNNWKWNKMTFSCVLWTTYTCCSSCLVNLWCPKSGMVCLSGMGACL